MKKLLLLSMLLLLSACGSGDEEIQDWISQQKLQSRPRVTPLKEPKKFEPEEYSAGNLVDPFNMQKLTLALKRDSAPGNAALITPELSRRKEALEMMPLDSMAMVGSMVKGGVPVALVRSDNLLYQVKVGNHLGQNYGLVTKISETEVQLREIVQDASGDWVERPASLQLQEQGK